ncbi:uncharacterized protein PFL1_01068 [Pseudozyma flocculosa PF-1]|uniref:uncharacterized protein n=1 Tax=Pseudozyma flocculosa PF-1 TaxID=1277687 RepID=UPI00045616EF|nr:uncharacterized protein PFL1_01068 [Pseudozyma flocculosa PF-1]EPQ31735.1 hypothetical protein PFL1_01068 [Pseudozyma flocculosa PF-1]
MFDDERHLSLAMFLVKLFLSAESILLCAMLSAPSILPLDRPAQPCRPLTTSQIQQLTSYSSRSEVTCALGPVTRREDERAGIKTEGRKRLARPLRRFPYELRLIIEAQARLTFATI